MNYLGAIKEITEKINQRASLDFSSLSEHIQFDSLEEWAVVKLLLFNRNNCRTREEQKLKGFELLFL